MAFPLLDPGGSLAGLQLEVTFIPGHEQRSPPID
jgi:hypothetical protein